MLISDKERSEFDAWTGDDLQHAHAAQLKKAHFYYKSEGFDGTAAAVYARLRELGHTDETAAALNPSSDAEARSSIYDFQEEVKQRRRHLTAQRQGSAREDTRPALVRRGATWVVPESLPEYQKESTSVRRSQDLLHTSDQQLSDDTLILPASGTAPTAAGGSKHRVEHPLVQQMEMRGSKRTQEILEQNRGLSDFDKYIVAENSRRKGNDNYRCGQYAEAVEDYTLAIGMDPTQVVHYTNRAAAYLRLKQWRYAAIDATSALDLGKAAGTADGDPLMIKALLRRAEASMGAHEFADALLDYEDVLKQSPDDATAKRGAEKSQAALGIAAEHRQQLQQDPNQFANGKSSGMRRMVVQECEDDDGDNEQQLAGGDSVDHHQQAAEPPGLSPESETETETESEDEAQAESTLLPPSFEDQLEQLRMEGNNAFRADKYREALDLYSKALAHAPDAVQVYINRAITHLRLQQYRQAHEDATMALILQPDNHKAYHKRQQAKQGLEDYKGAIADMQQCIELAPRALRGALSVELQQLRDQSASADAAARAQAAAAQAAGYTDHGSVQIQEEVEDPEEIKQKRHDELVSAEQLCARKAAKAQQRAAEQRYAWRRQQEEQAKQQAEAAEAKQQARVAAREARREARRQARQQKKLTAGQQPASTADSSGKHAATFPGTLQKEATQSDAPEKQNPVADTPTAAAGYSSVEAQVEALKDQGNQCLAAGQYDDAEAAYIEALQLDGDNIKVLLNLALLRLKQGDGAAAVRCCDEVLAQQQLAQEYVMKAQLRRALALDLMGDSAAALSGLATVWEQRQAAGLPTDPQLAADMTRIAAKVQQQSQSQLSLSQLDETGSTAVSNQAVTPDAASAEVSTAAEQQQSPQAAQPVTAINKVAGMRASIPVTMESDSETETESVDGDEQLDTEHSRQAQQLPSSNLAGKSPATNGLLQQHAAEPNEAATGAADAPASSPNRCKIPVIEVDSSDEADNEAEELSDKIGTGDQPLNKQLTANSNTVDVAETVCSRLSEIEQVTQGVDDSSTSTAEQPAEVSEQTAHVAQQQPDAAVSTGPATATRVHHKRTRSSSDITASTTAATETALDAMKSLLEKDVTSGTNPRVNDNSNSIARQQQQHSPAAVTTTSSSNSSLETPSAVDVAEQHHQWEAQHFADLNRRRIEVLRVTLQTATSKDPSSAPAAFQQLQRTAEEQREKGNAAFSKGQLQQALKHYNAALSVAPMDEKAYANRAQVYLKLKRWPQVEADCNTALLLLRKAAESVNPVAPLAPQTASVQLKQKCMYRRALAWKELGKIREAIAEAKQLQRENPNDSAVQRLISDLKVAYSKHLHNIVAQQSQATQQDQQQQQAQQQTIQQQEAEQEAEESKPSASSSEPVSQVHRHRIFIEETDDSGSEEEEQNNRQQADAAAAAIGHEANGEQGEYSENHSKQQQQQEAPQRQQAKPVVMSTFQQNGNCVHAASPAAASLTAKAVQQVLQQKQLTAPKSAVEFLRVAKSLCSASGSTAATTAADGAAVQGPQQIGQYVKLVEPSKYTTVFKRDLSDAVVEFLLLGLREAAESDPNFATQALQQLSKVERFGIVMSMASRKKRVSESLQHIMQKLTAAGQPVEELKAMYKVA